MWEALINSFIWLPWYLQLLLIFPIGIFTIMAILKLIMAVVDIVLKVVGVFKP
jgi:hypothetical protein